MAETKKFSAKWHEELPTYVDLSDMETHRLLMIDDGTEVKLPQSKSDFNVSFLVKEWDAEQAADPKTKGWVPNNMTLGAKKALRKILKIQEETGSLVNRVFDVTRSGKAFDTVYEIKEVFKEELEAMEA
jgi:hypothetical protein